MNMRVNGLPSQYIGYKVDVNKIRNNIEKQNEAESFGDRAVISEEGKRALEASMAEVEKQRNIDRIRHLSSVSSYGYKSDFEKALSDLGQDSISDEYLTGNYEKEISNIASKFEKEEGEKTDSFDRHVNKAVSVFNMMRDKIEAKYADSQRKVEYYVADSGEIEELTREKELEMLEEAYANHSTFMATSTEIWVGLQDFTPSIVYHKVNKQSDEELSVNESGKEEVIERSEKGQIKDMVSKAFLSAISDENRISLSQYESSLNHYKLKLGISALERERLNGIWDFYANKE